MILHTFLQKVLFGVKFIENGLVIIVSGDFPCEADESSTSTCFVLQSCSAYSTETAAFIDADVRSVQEEQISVVRNMVQASAESCCSGGRVTTQAGKKEVFSPVFCEDVKIVIIDFITTRAICKKSVVGVKPSFC
tara:strand:+ start:7899 stop:8303 length:405 start_codon:yes stop_codon:yes gene_type:complete